MTADFDDLQQYIKFFHKVNPNNELTLSVDHIKMLLKGIEELQSEVSKILFQSQKP